MLNQPIEGGSMRTVKARPRRRHLSRELFVVHTGRGPVFTGEAAQAQELARALNGNWERIHTDRRES